MKKVLLTLVVLSSSICSWCQVEGYPSPIAEPEYIADVILVQDGKVIEPEKQKFDHKTKISAGAVLTGGHSGNVSATRSVKGIASPVTLKSDSIYIIAKVPNNNQNPEKVVYLIEMKVLAEKDLRYFNIAKFNAKTGKDTGNDPDAGVIIPYKSRKYGNSSVLITAPKLGAGQYGVYVQLADSEIYNLFQVQ